MKLDPFIGQKNYFAYPTSNPKLWIFLIAYIKLKFKLAHNGFQVTQVCLFIFISYHSLRESSTL